MNFNLQLFSNELMFLSFQPGILSYSDAVTLKWCIKETCSSGAHLTRIELTGAATVHDCTIAKLASKRKEARFSNPICFTHIRSQSPNHTLSVRPWTKKLFIFHLINKDIELKLNTIDKLLRLEFFKFKLKLQKLLLTFNFLSLQIS